MTDYRNGPATLRRRQDDVARHEQGHRRIHRVGPESDAERSLRRETAETEDSIGRQRQDDGAGVARRGAADGAWGIRARIPCIECLHPGVMSAVAEVGRVLCYG
jgi:hypothetical protein